MHCLLRIISLSSRRKFLHGYAHLYTVISHHSATSETLGSGRTRKLLLDLVQQALLGQNVNSSTSNGLACPQGSFKRWPAARGNLEIGCMWASLGDGSVLVDNAENGGKSREGMAHW